MTEPSAFEAHELADATAAVLRPVRTGNAFEETVERILVAMKLGLVREGDRLPPERELSARLNVSRVTLREALRALQEAGYVESRRGRMGGNFVTYRPGQASFALANRIARDTGGELTDALAFREAVEVGAVGIAARRPATAAESAQLCRWLEATRKAGLAEYRRADSRLHLAIAELSGSRSLVAAVADVRMRINDLLDAIPLLERNIAHSNEQHDAIVAAVLAGEPDAASRAMRDHLEGTAALLRGFLG
jgi:DNA-binding FadR family transcriptional regulator